MFYEEIQLSLFALIMDVIFTIGSVIQWIVLGYLAFGTLYIFLFAVASLMPYRTGKVQVNTFHRIAVLIPGYKEDAVILEAAAHGLEQNYPRNLYDLIVIADSFQPSTLKRLNELPVTVLEVSFEKSTKSNALNEAMRRIPDGRYEIVVILDADNVMENEFLTQINQSYNAGYRAIQGHRIAKNTNTPFAVLDAVSEEINNAIFRKGHRVLGLSSSLIGSGMAFGYLFFKELMLTVKAVGGFDKEIELKMLKSGVSIEYLDHALVYDEKVQRETVFVKQRRRWLSAQIHYAGYLGDALKTFLLSANTDYLDKAVQMILPPRILLIGLLPLFTLLSLLVNPLSLSLVWAALFMLLILTLLFAIPGKFYTFTTFIALFSIPKGILLMLFSLFSTKGANKTFIHTEHTPSDADSDTHAPTNNKNPKL